MADAKSAWGSAHMDVERVAPNAFAAIVLRARLSANRILESMGAKPPSWGRAKLAALQAADHGDLKPLLDFVRF